MAKRKMQLSVRFTFNMTPIMKKRIQRECEHLGMSESQFIRGALRTVLMSVEQERIRQHKAEVKRGL